MSTNSIGHRVALSLLTRIGPSVGLSQDEQSDHSDGPQTHDTYQNRVKPVFATSLKLLVT